MAARDGGRRAHARRYVEAPLAAPAARRGAPWRRGGEQWSRRRAMAVGARAGMWRRRWSRARQGAARRGAAAAASD